MKGTNKVCTPFVYKGDEHDDCLYDNWVGYWCLYKRKYHYCGDCVDQNEETTKNSLITEVTTHADQKKSTIDTNVVTSKKNVARSWFFNMYSIIMYR